MLALLALGVLVLTAVDHWTTYLCLRQTVEGFAVREANPLAAWLFGQVGLAPGLWLDTAVTAIAIAVLVATPRLPGSAKALFLGIVGVWTLGAVANNLRALETLGLLAATRP